MHLFPTVIATADSPYSGLVRVVDGFGFRHLSTDKIQHSGGIVSQIWTTALNRQSPKRHRTWLVLGVAGGSVIQLISRKYHPTQITGIDIDPVIVELGKKYFGLSKITNLNLIIASAQTYLSSCSQNFDYILVDLFGVDSCPKFVYSPAFLKKLSVIGKKIFINHLYHTPQAITLSHQLEVQLSRLKPDYTSQKISKNIVYSF